MNSTELLETFREEMNDVATPYLWSDLLVYRYINDAQEMFCRLTEGIEDSSDETICRLAIESGTEWYATSPLILKIREAVDTSTGRPYGIVNMEKASTLGVLFNGNPGPLKLFVTGLEKNKLRAWPKPNEDAEVELRVFRLPKPVVAQTAITDDGDQVLEIDDRHHLSLLMWMKHKAYGKEDAETFDRRKSDEFEARFRAYCSDARIEQERARRSVGTVMYGGI
jgi:hypothetical protein